MNARFTGEARHLRRLVKMTAQENRLRGLEVFGQSVWLDYIRRSLITSGELKRLITEDGLRGVTSKAIPYDRPGAPDSDNSDMPRIETHMTSPSPRFRRYSIPYDPCSAKALLNSASTRSRSSGTVILMYSSNEGASD